MSGRLWEAKWTEAGSLGRLEVTNVSRIVALSGAPSVVFYEVQRLREGSRL